MIFKLQKIMDKVFFSLIVPVYNVEKYLERCLNSILSQDYTDYEIICVNDGSTDSSLKILKEYAAKNTKIKIVSQVNQGLGEARNTGLKYVTGDFVWFIDSDDWIEEGALRLLNQFVLLHPKYNVIVINAFRTSDKGEKTPIYALSRQLGKEGKIDNDAYIKSLLNSDSIHSAWIKLFQKDVIKQYKFSKGFYEDVPLIRVYHQPGIHIGYLPKPFYNYFYREGSIMTKVDKRLLDMYRQYDLVYREYKDSQEYKLGLSHLLYYWTGKQLSNVDSLKYSEIKDAIYQEFIDRKKNVLSFGRLMLSDINIRRKMKLLLFKLKFKL